MQLDTTITLDLPVFLLVGACAVRWLENRIDQWPSESNDPADARKDDIAGLRTEIRRVEDKVDDCNQRLARVEGIILAREDMVDTIADSPQ